MPMKIVLSVDPGLQTGYAIWERDKLKEGQPSALLECGEIDGTRVLRELRLKGHHIFGRPDEDKWHLEARAIYLAFAHRKWGRILHGRTLRTHLEHIVIEWPVLFAGAKGHAAAAGGALAKLAFMDGLFGAIAARESARMTVVAPREWKGQLSKDMVRRRVQAIINQNLISEACTGNRMPGELWPWRDHAYEAIGIGLWWGGYF